MLGVKKLCALALSICLLWFLAVPAFAADPQVTSKDLKGIGPKHHRYAFAVIGGAAVGMGVGAAIGAGWSNDIAKGLLIGSGAASALYLHSHKHDTLNGWRNWAYLGSYTALGGGIGWTVCGCNPGLGAGLLVGGGATAIWLAENPQRTHPTATNVPNAPAPQPPPQP
jgi:hypothetical protein